MCQGPLSLFGVDSHFKSTRTTQLVTTRRVSHTTWSHTNISIVALRSDSEFYTWRLEYRDGEFVGEIKKVRGIKRGSDIELSNHSYRFSCQFLKDIQQSWTPTLLPPRASMLARSPSALSGSIRVPRARPSTSAMATSLS